MTDQDKIALEQSVLGACLLKQEIVVQAIAMLGPTSECFTSANKAIWQAIIRLHDNNDPVDPTTVIEDLHLAGELNNADGAVYIANLASRTPTTANAATYARMLRDRNVLATVKGQLKDLAEDITEGLHPDQAQVGLKKVEQHLANTQRQEPPIPIADVLPAAVENLNKKWDNTGLCDGIPSGFDDLDALTSGFHGGDLVIVAARTSIGKTAFALAIAHNVARGHLQSHVVFYSLEMSAESLTQRLLGVESDNNMRICHAKPAREEVLDEPAKRLAMLPLYIQDFRAMNSAKLHADLYRHIAARGAPDLIVIDYVQYMSAMDPSLNRTLQISEITKSIKGFAREHDVPVILLSQINRTADEHGNEPSLNHLKESSAIEEDADMVIILDKDRPTPPRRGEPPAQIDESLLRVKLAKNRNGPIGATRLTFDRETQRITGTRVGFYRQMDPAAPQQHAQLIPPDDEPFDEFDKENIPEAIDIPEPTQTTIDPEPPKPPEQPPEPADEPPEPEAPPEQPKSPWPTIQPRQAIQPADPRLDAIMEATKDDPNASIDGYPINSFVIRIYEASNKQADMQDISQWAKSIAIMNDMNDGGLERLDAILNHTDKANYSQQTERNIWEKMVEFAENSAFNLETGKRNLAL